MIKKTSIKTSFLLTFLLFTTCSPVCAKRNIPLGTLYLVGAGASGVTTLCLGIMSYLFGAGANAVNYKEAESLIGVAILAKIVASGAAGISGAGALGTGTLTAICINEAILNFSDKPLKDIDSRGKKYEEHIK